MLEFRSPEVSDKQWIYELASISNLPCADSSFGNIYCWSHSTAPKIARLGNRLVMRLCIGGKCMYAYPVGSGDIRPAIELMAEDARSIGSPFIMRSITRPLLSQIHTFFRSEPVISTNPDSSDYVYLASDLANLSGKKFHAKKNHVNRFMAEHQWSFEPITPENIHSCHNFASHWFIEAESERGVDYLSEIRAMRNAFDIYFEAGYDGGIVLADGQIVAFTMGELISPDTFVTHFEKARASVNGGYSIINQQFAKYLLEKYPGLTYINREEDMGIENLRKAKQSYRPVFMVDKYTAIWE